MNNDECSMTNDGHTGLSLEGSQAARDAAAVLPVGMRVPAWKLWANPIIRRYCRARLRPQQLGAALLVTVLITGFVFFMFRMMALHRTELLLVDAERMPIPALLVIQALILFFLGTGQVAGGITGEADEGVLDYQRLTPMTPLAKVLGCWFGLPVREWLMFAATLPFSAWCFWRGQVPVANWAPVYAAFITSALLYHLTGLTAGMVIKNRRWAFLMSMGIILLLYTVMPQASKFGLLFFDYITIGPVLDENIHVFLPREAGALVELAGRLVPNVKFFGLEFRELAFTLFCQGGVMLTLVVMVWRRWRRVESHLLGKAWAVGLFAWVQLLLIGNALPLIAPGMLFPSMTITARFNPRAKLPEPVLNEGLTVIALYGLVTLLMILALTTMITPATETQLRGLRRARKLGLARVPRFSDPASALPFTLVLVGIGAVAWWYFASAVMASKWFPGHALPASALPVFALVLANAALGFHALMEGWGGRRLFLTVIFLGVLPPMTGFILGTTSNARMPLGIWLAALSPASGTVLAPAVMVPDADLPREVARAIPRAFWFCQTLFFLGLGWLLLKLRAIHHARRASVEDHPLSASTGPATSPSAALAE